MPIPKYDEMYRAFLDCLADGQLHRSKEVKDTVAGVFSVSEKERAEMLPSGKQQLFDNRIGWTRTYLKKAGLVQSPSRGIYVITPAGRQVLNENPPQIDNLYLQRFESFRKFISPNNNEEIALSTPMEKVSGKTPQDVLDEAFQQINTTLADDLLSEVMKQPPAFFEHLVVKLLMQMGYGGSVDNAGTVIGQTGDEGIDGIIREDKLGFSLIYIQAKRWDCDKTVGRPEIQKFVGALAGQGASKGLFITTAKFTKEARQYAEKQHTTKVVLVDGTTLAKLMMLQIIGKKSEYGALPRLAKRGLRDCQYDAEANLEASLKVGKKKALSILATGAGKTYLACLASYRLLNYTPTKRVLFLVDTSAARLFSVHCDR